MTPEENLKIKSLTDRSEIFNYVISHLKKQRGRSLSEHEDLCAYRGANETKCAVGVLIADDEYDSSMEGNSVLSLVEKNLLNPSLKKRIRKNLEFLSDLQDLHDNGLGYDGDDFSSFTKIAINSLRIKWDIAYKEEIE